MKIWIVTTIDYSRSCDGRFHICKAFRTEDEACSFVKLDMREWANDHSNEGHVICDFNNMIVFFDYDNESTACAWNVKEVEVE